MTNTPMKLIVDLSKPEGEREQYIPLTAEEIAQQESDAQAYAEAEAAREASETAKAALKASAKAKLIAGEPLTAEEADTLIL
jgi:membrane protein involved in colicin uptake